MAEYKCIYCGKVRQSERICLCPNCGYKMYPMPYERKQVLADEINVFLQRLRLNEVKEGTVKFFRRELSDEKKTVIIQKAKDDARFPDFDTIQNYVCAGKKSEEFFSRLEKSLEEIKIHIHAEYQRCYEIDFEDVKAQTEALDVVLQDALREIGLPCELEEAVFPKATLEYYETSNMALIDMADELLDLLEQLSAKVRKFIKANNIYGTGYQKKIKPSLKQFEGKDDQTVLRDVTTAAHKALTRKYEVDLFSDGAEELHEMLMGIWTGVWAVMTLPVLEKRYIYRFENGETVIGGAFSARIISTVSMRYAGIRSPVVDADFLSARDEDAMLDLYNRMIQLDSFDLMGLNGANLMKLGESEKELNRLIGLSGIKDTVRKIRAYALANKKTDSVNLHMCFYGNPGTGKTEVARIIAGILYESKILPTKRVVEVDRGGLVGQYVGETPQKTMQAVQNAMGGVLFIDEAYALIPKDGGAWDYGQEAVATLIKAMEDYRGKFCVILAGYKNQMRELLSTNPGFQSRIQFELDFPNYDRNELRQIANLMLTSRKYIISDAAMDRLLDVADMRRKAPNFANAREIRNILEQVIMCQNLRTGGIGERELGMVDVNRYIADAQILFPVSTDSGEKKILTGEEELERLVGLASVKRMVRKIRAYARKNREDKNFNLHMCFCGNPGTGKTEVARILSRILYDAGVLAESKLVEVDAAGLIGKAIGETGPKTLEKIQSAMGGVLFIDEAYGLATAPSGAKGYGDEAVEVLLKEMEDHRGQICVILAGYRREMENLLHTNPGFASRIQFTLDFSDYTREELGEIAKTFLRDKNYEMDDQTLSRLLDVAEYYRGRPNFANARTVRNILDQVLMNQNLRTEDNNDDRTLTIDDIEDYILDEGINFNAPLKRRIGFSAD